MRLRSNVLAYKAAAPHDAAAHFAHRLAVEVDCADVGSDLAAGIAGFTVVDCRAPSAYAEGHVPGAVNLPYRRMNAETVARLLPPDGLLVTYCDGPHCNASTHGALRLAELGREVKEMIGGLDGWRRDGLPVES